VEWGPWSREERDALRVRAKELGASAELIYLDVPADELWRRIQERDREDPPIQRSDLDAWFQVFQPPDAAEMRHYSLPSLWRTGCARCWMRRAPCLRCASQRSACGAHQLHR
jgi:hypothetical protein